MKNKKGCDNHVTAFFHSYLNGNLFRNDALFREVEHVLAVGLHAFVFLFRANDELVPLAEPRSRRNQVAADDVLFHAFEPVLLATDGCFVEHLGGFLEGGGRHERLGLQGGAGDALEDLGGGGGGRRRARQRDGGHGA